MPTTPAEAQRSQPAPTTGEPPQPPEPAAESGAAPSAAAQPSEAPAKPGIAGALVDGLWFPAVFFAGFLLCYLLPFHNPAPHDVHVAVANPVVAAQLEAGLDKQAPGAYDIAPVADAAAARQKVLDRDAVGAYAVAPDGRSAVLYVAKGNGTYLEQALTSTFTPVAGQGHQKLAIRELAPTAHGDATGTSLFYLAMVWNIVPYITVMMLMRAFTLSRRAKLLAFAGVGAVITVVGYLVGLGMDIIPNAPLAMVYGFLITQAVAWTVYGLVPFVRQFIPGVAIVLFVLLSIPSSGGAIPWQMVPEPFRWLHPVMPLGNLIDALHGIFYFDGKGLLRPTIVLCVWLAAGAALIAAGALLQRRMERAAAASREAGAEAGSAVEEAPDPEPAAPVEDASIEMPLPHAVRPHPTGRHHRGGEPPMLYGTVLETGGRPVPHAVITVLDGRGRQLMRTSTDESGGYAATGLPKDHLTLLLSAPGWTPAAARVLPRDGIVVRQDFLVAPHPQGAAVN